MITVKVHKDIREYKEKIVFGLTGRGIISVIVGVLLIAPLLIFGRKAHISADLLFWLMMFIAIPVGLIGFYKPDGIPFEKFLFSTVTFMISKKKLFFQSENKFKTAPPKEKLKRNIKIQRSIERAIIIAEALENGEKITLEEADKRLVDTKLPKQKPPKPPKKTRKDKQKERETELLKKADNIRLKQENNQFYIYEPREIRVMKKATKIREKNRKLDLQIKKKAIKPVNKKAKKRRKAKTLLPKSTQDLMPYIAVHENGIFEVESGVYSKLYQIDDLNYVTASQEKQVEIFANYAEFLNIFDEDARISIYVDNRVISKSEQERRVFYKLVGDDFDKHREEYNGIMRRQMEVGRNEMSQEKYVSAIIKAETFAEAKSRFHKIDMEIEDGLRGIGSSAYALSTTERLEILHDKFRKGYEGEFKIDFDFLDKNGVSSKDYIAPSYAEFSNKEFKIDEEFYRVVNVSNIPSQLSDNFFSDFVDNDFPLTATIHVVPLAQHKSIDKLDKQKTGMEGNIIAAQRKASRQNISPELMVSTKLKKSYEDALELEEDLTQKGQKLFYVSVMIMFSAPTIEKLNERENELSMKVRKITAQLQSLTCRQFEGLRACLPCGSPVNLGVDRALTSENTATFIPFACQELSQRGGFYYGLNGISRNLILFNRTRLKQPSGFFMGTTGFGKSFAIKREMLNVVLKDKFTPIIVIDPDNEYAEFVKNFGGEVINISADSRNFINPMEMNMNYGLDLEDENLTLERKKEKALRKKSDYIMSLVTCMLAVDGVSTLKPQQKSFIDKCVKAVYKKYLENDFNPDFLPTLKDLQAEFDRQKDVSEDAKLVADGAEYFTNGSMDVFAHNTNVNLKSRIISFNIKDLGEQLFSLGLLIILDFIWNKMCENNDDSVRTFCYADEIHILLKNKITAEFMKQFFKRGRKYGLIVTGITQNIEDLTKNDIGRGMISNSQFLVLLKQQYEDLKILQPMLRLSETQCTELENATAGCGLLKADKTIIPFRDKFPQESYLYKLMSTDFNEKVAEKEREKNAAKA